jgi:hypothetical protein
MIAEEAHRMGPQGIGNIYGQRRGKRPKQKNITTYNLARMNMLLHGVKDTEFEIFHGNTLTNEWDTLRELNPAKKPSFDAFGLPVGSRSRSARLPLGTNRRRQGRMRGNRGHQGVAGWFWRKSLIPRLLTRAKAQLTRSKGHLARTHAPADTCPRGD